MKKTQFHRATGAALRPAPDPKETDRATLRCAARSSIASLWALLVMLSWNAPAQNPFVISTVAGRTPTYDPPQPALSALLHQPQVTALDSQGRLYIGQALSGQILRMDLDGRVSAFASIPVNVTAPAVSGLAVDASNNVYASDGISRVYKVSPSGVITPFAGTSTQGSSGDGANAIEAQLSSPRGLAADRQGNVYIADLGNGRIRRVGPNGLMSTYASGLNTPISVAAADSVPGLIYVAEFNGHRIRTVNSSGAITVFAGTGLAGFGGTENASPTSTDLGNPTSVTVDGLGRVFVTTEIAPRVWMIQNGRITTIAGAPRTNPLPAGSQYRVGFADNITWSGAWMASPAGLSFHAPTGILYFADRENNRIRSAGNGGFGGDSTIRTVIGSSHLLGDGTQAANAYLYRPRHLAYDRAGNLYVSDAFNYSVRRIAPSGIITTVAGRGVTRRFDGMELAPATQQRLGNPGPVAIDPNGVLYVADGATIARMENGSLVSFSGFGPSGSTGDGGPALNARFSVINALVFDASGNLLIADQGRGIRQISPAGIVSTLVSLPNIRSIALDESGTIYAGEVNQITRITRQGSQSVITGLCGAIAGLTVSNGEVFATSSSCALIYLVKDGAVTRIGGNNTFGYSGDGGLALSASVNFPGSIVKTPEGDLLFADASNDRVRKLNLRGPCTVETLSPDSPDRELPGSGGPINIDIRASSPACDWTVRSDVSWIRVPTPANGVGNARLVLQVDPNPNLTPRTGNITAAGASITFRQAPREAAVTLLSASGDGQTGSAGKTLAEPVSVQVLNGSGRPIPGASVRFFVRNGQASVSAGTVIANAEGRASTNVTLGVFARVVEVAATVDDLDPVVFVLHAERDPSLPRILQVSTHAGTWMLNPATGLEATLFRTAQMAYLPGGDLLVADSGNHVVRLFAKDGSARLFAGTGDPGHSGDGGPASSATLTSPLGLAVDGEGRVYVTDQHRIRLIEVDGTIRTIAGGNPGFSGDGGPARAALFNGLNSLAIHPDGSLFIADSGNARIRRIASDGSIRTVAGGGAAANTADGIDAVSAFLDVPYAITFDRSGRLVFADNWRVRIVAVDGTVTTLAGRVGLRGDSGDGGPAALAALNVPLGLSVDEQGAILIADAGNNRIRRVSGGTITTVAGSGAFFEDPDASEPMRASIQNPRSVLAGPEGELLIGDSYFVRSLKSGTLRRIAGRPQVMETNATATEVIIRDPQFSAVFGNSLLISDTAANLVWKVDQDGHAVVFAGNGKADFSGDGGPAMQAGLRAPGGLAVDQQGNVFIADSMNRLIRKVDLDGRISTYAGDGRNLSAGDGGAAKDASFVSPIGLAVNPQGDLFIADAGANRIRRIDAATGAISSFAGTGTAGFAGDGDMASSALLRSPSLVAFSPADGSVVVGDAGNQRIRRVDASGRIMTIAGSGQAASPVEGSPALGPRIGSLRGIAVDEKGTVYFSDATFQRIAVITSEGIYYTIAGTGAQGFAGDGGEAWRASWNNPAGVTVDSQGNIYVADRNNHRVRVLRPANE